MTHMQDSEADHISAADTLEVDYPPMIDGEVFYDENAKQTAFLVEVMASVDDDLLKSGYPQLRVGQAHCSRALDLIRNGDPATARYLMVMNANLWLQQAQEIAL